MYSSSQLNSPDFTPVVLRKKSSVGSSPSNPTGYRGHGISASVKVEKQAEEGDFKVKKYDPAFVQQVIAYRAKQGLKQEDFAKRIGIAIADLKALEKNLPPYKPALVSRLKQVMA